jgi:uncharacterized protein (TIGR02266 family)
VITAASGAEGLALAREIRPDVALIDLHMPDLDGAALCRAIKSDPRACTTPVVIITSGDDPREHASAVRAGADDVIPKPVNRVSLIQAVNRLLRAPEVQGLPRVPVEARIRIRHEADEVWGRLENLSRGGLFVTSARSVPPETEVRLDFELPEMDTVLRPTAKVIWRREASSGAPEGMGLRFLELDRASAVRIEEYVYTHAGSPSSSAPPSYAASAR